MANVHHTHPSVNRLSSIGAKIKRGAEFLGTVKTAIDVGKGLYQTVPPMAAAAVAVA